MYYSEEILDEVRSRNDILDVIGTYVKLKRSGATYFGLCPFHSEKTPSFSVTPRKQMFYCFGCHKGGSVITFIQMYENCSFQEAVKMLADRAGIVLPQQEMDEAGRRRHDLRARLLEVNKTAAAYYYYLLRSRQGEQGMAYLRSRALSDETMKSFGLGYAGKYTDALYQYLKKKGYSDELIKQSGLMVTDKKGRMYDKFFNRVMFPIMDVNNRVIGFGGRVMGDGKPKYLNSPETEVFNKRRNLYGLNVARRNRENFMILCEGYMDVIAMHQAGFTMAVASLGTSLTDEHAALLRRYTENVILSYDSDDPGVNAAMRAIPMLRAVGISVRVLQLQPYKDPDEFIKAQGAQAFRERLGQARNGFMFEVDVLHRGVNDQDPDERTRFQQQVAQRIASFELEAQRENYIQAAADEYHMSFDGLRQMVNLELTRGVRTVYERTPAYEEDRPGQPGGAAQRREDGLAASQKLLLTWLTRFPGFYPVLKQYISPEDFQGDVYQEAARLLYSQLDHGKLDEVSIVDHFPETEDQNLVAEFFHTDMETQQPQDLEKAMKETIRKVSDAALTRRETQDRTPDLQRLQNVVERKRQMEALKNTHIDLNTQ